MEELINFIHRYVCMKINFKKNGVILGKKDVNLFYFGESKLSNEERTARAEELSETFNKRIGRYLKTKKSKSVKFWVLSIIEYLWTFESEEKKSPFMWVKLRDIKEDLLSGRKAGRPRLSDKKIPHETTLWRILNDLEQHRFIHKKKISRKILYRLNAEAFIFDFRSIYQEFDEVETRLDLAKEKLEFIPPSDIFERYDAAIKLLKEDGRNDPIIDIHNHILGNYYSPKQGKTIMELKELFKEQYIKEGKDPKNAERMAETAVWGY